MIRDPRNPDPNYMVHTGSTHEFHSNMRKTLVLLKIESTDGPIYFVIEGVSTWPTPFHELQEGDEYFYEESTCPTNFIRIPMIFHDGDSDPHGLFEHVETVWMMDEYPGENPGVEEYLAEVFPQLTRPSTANSTRESAEPGKPRQPGQ